MTLLPVIDALRAARTKGTYDLHGMAALKAPEPGECLSVRHLHTSSPYLRPSSGNQ